MKKILLKTISLLMMALAPLAMPAVNTIIHTVTYDFSQMSTGTDTLGGVTYTTVNYAGLYNDGAPGTPSLPVDYLRFSVPWNATNFSVTTSVRNNVYINIKHLVYPCQPHWLMDDTTQHPVTLPDSSAYYSGAQYPSQRAWVVDEGFLAGENHIVTVAVMPVSFINSGTGPATIRQLIKSRTVTLTLHYDLSDSLAMHPIVRQDTVLRQEGYRLAQSMVVNPNNVAAYAPMDVIQDTIGIINPNSGGDGLNGGGLNPPDPGVISNDSTSWYGGELDMTNKFDYLIVTTNDLRYSLRRLAALKRQEGYKVKMVTMNDVMNDSLASCGDIVDGQVLNTDSAGVLRQYLRNHFKYNGLQYVLLVGNIPYRIYYYTEGGKTYLTDWYYSDLNSHWADYFDKEPELFVGRIVAKSDEQVENYTNKQLMYEFNPGNGDYSYLRRAFYSNGRDFKNYLNVVIDSLNPIFPQKIIINDYIGNNTNYPKGHDIIDTLRTNRVGFMCIFNHGDTTRVKVYGKDTNDFNYFIKANSSETSGNGLQFMRNKYYPIIYYSPSCATAPFDNQTFSFGESFTTGKDYGGPIYIGHTRSVIADDSRKMTINFANQLLQNYHQLGVAYARSITLSSASCQEEIHTHCYLGDPLVELWTSEPNCYSGITIERKEHSIEISDIGTDSTTVAYYNNDGIPRRKTVTHSAVTLVGVSPNSVITLYKHNYLPYILPIELQKISINKSQYVFAHDFTAGSNVNNNRLAGAVTVKSGVEYEIEASGTVRLEDGFSVEKGATFAVYPSSVR